MAAGAGLTAPEGLVHRAAVFAHGDAVALFQQEARNHRPDLAIVFNDMDKRRAVHGPLHRGGSLPLYIVAARFSPTRFVTACNCEAGRYGTKQLKSGHGKQVPHSNAVSGLGHIRSWTSFKLPALSEEEIEMSISMALKRLLPAAICAGSAALESIEVGCFRIAPRSRMIATHSGAMSMAVTSLGVAVQANEAQPPRPHRERGHDKDRGRAFPADRSSPSVRRRPARHHARRPDGRSASPKSCRRSSRAARRRAGRKPVSSVCRSSH